MCILIIQPWVIQTSGAEKGRKVGTDKGWEFYAMCQMTRICGDDDGLAVRILNIRG